MVKQLERYHDETNESLDEARVAFGEAYNIRIGRTPLEEGKTQLSASHYRLQPVDIDKALTVYKFQKSNDIDRHSTYAALKTTEEENQLVTRFNQIQGDFPGLGHSASATTSQGRHTQPRSQQHTSRTIPARHAEEIQGATTSLANMSLTAVASPPRLSFRSMLPAPRTLAANTPLLPSTQSSTNVDADDRFLQDHGILAGYGPSYFCAVAGCSRGVQYRNAQELRNHFENQHAKCPICSAIISNEQNLEEYMTQIHSGPSANEAQPRESIDPADEDFQLTHRTETQKSSTYCPVGCGFHSINTDSLMRRLRMEHPNFPRFACSFTGCPGRFYDKKARSEHVELMHSTSSEYSCPICSADFREQPYLRKHMTLNHSDEHSVPCIFESCNKTFPSERSLKKHILKVHKEKPSTQRVLDTSQKTFNTTEHMEEHFESEHESQGHVWPADQQQSVQTGEEDQQIQQSKADSDAGQTRDAIPSSSYTHAPPSAVPSRRTREESDSDSQSGGKGKKVKRDMGSGKKRRG